MTSTLALRTAVAVQTTAFHAVRTGRQRISAAARGRQDGLTTLEIVIWGLGLFLAAGIAVGVITQAITSRTDQIK